MLIVRQSTLQVSGMDDYEVYMNLVTIYGHSDKRYATRIVVAEYGSSPFYDVPFLSLGFIICL